MMWWSHKKQKDSDQGQPEGATAREEAERHLALAKSERHEVFHVSSVLRTERKENHFSRRIEKLMRSAQ